MASHPMPHSFAKVADERGRDLTSPLTQHEKLRRYEFGLDFPDSVPTTSLKNEECFSRRPATPTSARFNRRASTKYASRRPGENLNEYFRFLK